LPIARAERCLTGLGWFGEAPGPELAYATLGADGVLDWRRLTDLARADREADRKADRVAVKTDSHGLPGMARRRSDLARSHATR
jgi:hypothetical protein